MPCKVTVSTVETYSGGASCRSAADKRHLKQLKDINSYVPKNLVVSHKSRNDALNSFYSSDEDFLVLFDYDTVLKLYYDAYSFVRDLSEMEWMEYHNIGVIRSLVPSLAPFKRHNYELKEIVERAWLLEPSVALSPSSLLIIPNVKKKMGQEVYFEESNSSVSLGYESYDFVLSLVEIGIPSYVCRQLVTSSPLESKETKGVRKSRHAQNVMLTYSRHPNLRVRSEVVDNKVKSDVRKLNVKEAEWVPRQQLYTFEPNLVPKEKERRKVDLLWPGQQLPSTSTGQ